MAGERWIVIRNWDRFQHYGAMRTPPWIRVYTELLHNEDYLGLSATQRATLHGLWLEYAMSRGNIPESTPKLSRKFRVRVTKRTLEALNQAGFIEFVASKPLALDLSRGEESRKETPISPVDNYRGGAAKRRRVAEEWLAGPGREVPESQLATVLREDLKITDPDMLAQLLVRAQEFRD